MAHWRNVRTAQGSVAGNTCPPRGEDQSNRDESAQVFGSAPGETGNLYAQQYQVGERGGLPPPGAPGSSRVGSTEPLWRQAAQRNGGHVRATGRTESGVPADFTLFWVRREALSIERAERECFTLNTQRRTLNLFKTSRRGANNATGPRAGPPAGCGRCAGASSPRGAAPPARTSTARVRARCPSTRSAGAARSASSP
jgi:hypothetical protein